MCENAIRVGDYPLKDRLMNADGVIVASNWQNYPANKSLDLVKKIKSFGVTNVLVVGKKQFPTIKNEEFLNLNEKELQIF